MNPALFPILASVLTFSAPCITMNVDCEQGVRVVLLEIHRTPPPWPLTQQPVEWTALAACPPSTVTWCPTTTPPFWLSWETWDSAGWLVGRGSRYYP